jgi:predicted DNA-binding ribbon-helix-helix protein
MFHKILSNTANVNVN